MKANIQRPGATWAGWACAWGFIALLSAGQTHAAPASQPSKARAKAPGSQAPARPPVRRAAPAPRTASKPAAGIAQPQVPTAKAYRTTTNIPHTPNIRYQYKPQEMLAICKQAVQEAKDQLEQLVKRHKDLTKASFATVVVPFEKIFEHMGDPIGVFWLLKSTTANKAFKRAGNKCLQAYFGLSSNVYARADLYKLFQAAATQSKGLKRLERFLLTKYLKSFVRNGASLAPAKRKRVAALNAKLSALSMKFQSNLAQDNTRVSLTQSELEGVPASVVAGLKKSKDGKYSFRVRIASMYLAFLQNARRADVRKKILLAYEDAAGADNTKILEEIIKLRDEMARLLGFPTYAHYVLDERMAKTPKNVKQFFQSIQPQLRKKMDAELKVLLALKRKENPKATQLNAWDWRYYLNQLKKTKYAIDDEAIRRYFPMDHVIKSVFAIYQKLLNVSFVEQRPSHAWHQDVRLFEIIDNKTKKRVAFFYLDLFPRPGKYTHFAAFGFLGGRGQPSNYRTPVSSVVGNWRRPLKGQDSLLSHQEVVTFFHEFGHIMHQTLTRVYYGSLAGTSVKRDFVEAPSQMLENWCWDPAVLKQLSKHDKTGKPLPDALIQKMIAAQHFDSGLTWTRQLFYAIVDMTFHTSGPIVDTAKVWRKVVARVMPIGATKGTRPAAGFGHLMGYAAGYYGYLWSKVYAQDMFTVFESKGLLSAEAGARYRTWILEKGGAWEPITLIKGFLGRDPNPRAFYRSLGLTVPATPKKPAAPTTRPTAPKAPAPRR